MNLIFCDTETTGLDEQRDHILEIALVAVELPTFREVACFDMVVTPPLWPTVRKPTFR
jgi:DNA polymerase III epsilon subunit-like protein